MRFITLLFSIILVLCIDGCGYISIKSDDIAPAAMEKNVNASTTRSAAKTKALASYTTEFNEISKGRAHNIKLAAEKINGTVLEPEQVFSYNEAVGKTGKSSGFKKARIFVKGQDAEGYGGGVCQVSSTLYNAALKAELEIIERHPHSKPVYYVPKDKDAATSYGGIDLKFKNITDNKLVIKAYTNKGKLTVDIIDAE